MQKITTVQKFWRILAPYRRQIYIIYLYALLSGFVNLSLPLGIQAIINFIQSGRVTTSWFILVGFVLVGIAVSGIFQILQIRIVENIQQSIFSKAAIEFSYRLPKIKLLALDKVHAPELVNRFFDIISIQKGLPKILIDFSLATFQIVFGLLLLAVYNATFLFLPLIFVLIIWIIYRLTAIKGLETSLYESKQKYKMAHWLEEVARTNKSFKSMAYNNLHMHQSNKIAVDWVTARENHFSVIMRQFKFFVGFKIIVAASLLILGSMLVFNDQMNIGQFVAAEIIIILIISSVEKVIQSVETLYDVLTALEKVGYVTDLDLDDNGEVSKDELQFKQIKLEVNDLNFKYPNSITPLIQNLSFIVNQADKVSITGKNGSGKSTLLKLLAGFYDCLDGEILYNNFRINNINKDILYPHIGFYFPTNALFQGSIKDNICMGKDISQQRVMEVIELLHLDEFLSHQPKGLKTNIDAAGRRLPRGIIQKLLIARAIVHQPSLLIMEDPLQALETINKKEIVDYIMSQDWTVIVVADDEYWQTKSNKNIDLN